MSERLSIVLSNSAGIPIYEQIKTQIKAAILAGELVEGDRLPSIRGLARDLRVSVITTTRAYADLAAEGFVANVQGKGSFVLAPDSALVREHVLREVEEHLEAAVAAAELARVDAAQLHTMLDLALGAGPSALQAPAPPPAPDEATSPASSTPSPVPPDAEGDPR